MSQPFADLLLVHGSPGDSASWKKFTAALPDRYAAHAPTLFGHGRDDGAPAAYGVADHAADVVGLAETLTAPLVLIGHSFGGGVALRAALELAKQGRPPAALLMLEPVAMAALATTGRTDARSQAHGIFSAYVDSVETGEADATAMIDFWFGAGAFARMPEALRDYMNGQTAVNARDIAATFDERYEAAELAAMTAPARIVIGGDSPVQAAEVFHATAAVLPNAEIATLPGAGHGMLATHGAELAASIDSWLAAQI